MRYGNDPKMTHQKNLKISRNSIIRKNRVLSRFEFNIQLNYWLNKLINSFIKPAINKQINIKFHCIYWIITTINPCSFVVFIVHHSKWMLWISSCVMVGRYLNNERCYWFCSSWFVFYIYLKHNISKEPSEHTETIIPDLSDLLDQVTENGNKSYRECKEFYHDNSTTNDAMDWESINVTSSIAKTAKKPTEKRKAKWVSPAIIKGKKELAFVVE